MEDVEKNVLVVSVVYVAAASAQANKSIVTVSVEIHVVTMHIVETAEVHVTVADFVQMVSVG